MESPLSRLSQSKTNSISDLFLSQKTSSKTREDEDRLKRRASAILQEKLLGMDKPKIMATYVDTGNDTPRRGGNGYEVKIMLLGDSGVGKTSLLRAWCEGDFNLKFLPTIGLDYRAKNVVVDSHKLAVQVWDSAGQERFRVITQAYYRGSHGMLLVFDVNDRKSFNAVSGWVKHVMDHITGRKIRFVLVGNKVDLANRVVGKEEGEKLAKTFGVPYLETSAKDFSGIDEAFTILLREVVDEQFVSATKLLTASRTQQPVIVSHVPTESQTRCSC